MPGSHAGAVDYIEAHGTGTALGDPIEMHALCAVFGARARVLRVGSVKTNIGHTEAAAGIAGLIKAILMLRRQAVPASLHFTRLNPHIDLGDAPVEVPTAFTPAALDCIGVSSFGFSGTNAHVVVQAAPAAAPAPPDPRPLRVLALSAREPAALAALAARWQAALAAPDADFAALCHTAGAGRARFAHRLAVVAGDAASAAAALAAAPCPASAAGRPVVAFLCTGQGSAHAGMAAGLAQTQPVFRAVLERCDAVMGLGRPLAALFGDAAALARTDFAQPALFALSAGLGALWRSWGIEPVAVLGHSVGEYAAAQLAGVLTLEDAARLVAARGRLMQALPAGGAMAALLGPVEASRALLARHPQVELAGENSALALTVAGPGAAVAALLADPALGGELAGQLLPLGQAFHSRLLEPMLDGLAAAAAEVAHAPAALPVVGNLDGSVVARHDAAYWRAHARAPVRFAAGLATLAGLGVTHLVELGAQPVLSGFARTALPGVVTLASLSRGRAGVGQDQAGVQSWRTLLDALARLWRDGAAIDWQGHDAPYRCRAGAAPGYPFQRQRYWLPDPTLDPTPAPAQPAEPPRPAPDIGDRRVSAFYDELAGIAEAYADAADPTEGHLTFGLLPDKPPGFSWIAALFAGSADPAASATLRHAQAALKQAIFAPVDFSRAATVLDFGCGHGADLCDLARRHPHLRLDGCTISARQVAVATGRAAALGLAGRLQFHHRDSARDAFPGQYRRHFRHRGLRPDRGQGRPVRQHRGPPHPGGRPGDRRFRRSLRRYRQPRHRLVHQHRRGMGGFARRPLAPPHRLHRHQRRNRELSRRPRLRRHGRAAGAYPRVIRPDPPASAVQRQYRPRPARRRDELPAAGRPPRSDHAARAPAGGQPRPA